TATAWRRDGSVMRHAIRTAERYSVEDLDRVGIVVRRSVHELAIAPALTVIPPADAPIIVALRTGATGPVERATALTPIGMAIAIGGGGAADRAATNARLARRLVRRLAQPKLAHRLDQLGFDRTPRMLDAARVGQVVRELAGETSVDNAALVEALIDEGATGL